MKRGGIDVALAELGKLESVLSDLANVPRIVAEKAAPRISRLLKRQFSAGTDPYGRRWPKLATGAAAHLEETQRMRDGTKATPNIGGRAGIRIVVGAMGKRRRNPIVHQTGAPRNNMPARKILPERGMPREWKEALDRSAREAYAEKFRRVRA